jgi:hypothetical protein
MINGIAIRVVAIVVSAVFVAGSWLVSGSADLAFLRFFSVAVLIVTSLFTLWDRVIWKWRIVQRLPNATRNLSGTWETWLESFWVNPATGERVASKMVYVVVRQTSSEVSVTLLSDESRSKSSTARILQEDGTWLLHYLYSNEPDLKFRPGSPIHHGSGVLRVSGYPTTRISGSYWTDRESKGQLTLNRRLPQYADDFLAARDRFAAFDAAKAKA